MVEDADEASELVGLVERQGLAALAAMLEGYRTPRRSGSRYRRARRTLWPPG